ncbi:NAD-binding protein [Paeniglutamicibacter antarcticus]|uniref:NAD-binding protein n=2 Tax=Arthrobacter terrae TaxID=2935737 RepID=A0A931CPE6_9MICC|nr:NAD-binding protein [Arthrobacter terrae]
MGAPMAANLLRAGWQVTAWNRSEPALADLAAQGGHRAASVSSLDGEPIIIFMLPDLNYIADAAVGLLDSWRSRAPEPGTAVVVMSSVSPAGVRDFSRAVHSASAGNAVVIDAPVSGGVAGAQAGTLAIMAGGPEPDFNRLRPLFEALGSTVRRLGEVGAGSLAKACNQLIVGTTTAALAEAAELAERSGMDAAALFDVLAGGLAGSAVLESLGPRLAAKDYRTLGPAKFMHKDLTFVLESARQSGTAVPLATAAHEVYATVQDQGLGEFDLAVVRQAIANLSGAQLSGAQLSGAQPSGAQLSDAHQEGDRNPGGNA